MQKECILIQHNATATVEALKFVQEIQIMLTIKCSGCKRKLWKYRKTGPGQVLRCHKSRITRKIESLEKDGWIMCPCGQVVGIDQGGFYKMISRAFIFTGTKDTS